MTKQITLMVLIVLLATACVPLSTDVIAPDSTSESPVITDLQTQEEPVISPSHQPKDPNLTRGNIYIQETGLVIRESYPPQIALIVSGDLPTPCHQLAADISEPDTKNKIFVVVYSVVDPNMACTQVMTPFQETLELGTFPSGHYTVWVNEELAGEFDS